MARDPNGNIAGTAGNDLLWGTALVLSGSRYNNYSDRDTATGNAPLRGYGGDDTILRDIYYNGTDYCEGDLAYGSDGNDVIYGSSGSDNLFGDEGTDRLYGLIGDDTLEGGNGADVLRGGAGNDRLLGGGFYAKATDAGDQLFGEDGNDVLMGNAGHDSLYGGNDSLQGDAGDDLMEGGTGADSLYCDAGKDIYVIDSTGDRLIWDYYDSGIDGLRSAISWTLGAYQENLTLTGSAAKGIGNAGTNIILGNAVTNVLSGRAGSDSLSGGAGNDTLFGGSGRDTLLGGSGNDALVGNSGDDLLIGGLGAERFVFFLQSDSSVSSTGRDVIADFSRSQGDQIDLTEIDANTGLSGNQAFRFIGSTGFTGQAGQLHAQSVSGGTLISGDVNGDRVADFAILLDDRIMLNANYFLL